jgi:hypothetical protein
MAGHDAKWTQVPDFDTGAVGQYYCSRCKLLLMVGYNKNENESATGWFWEIHDSVGGMVDSAGNEYVATYEPGIGLLDDVREEGLRRFDAVPCRRSN